MRRSLQYFRYLQLAPETVTFIDTNATLDGEDKHIRLELYSRELCCEAAGRSKEWRSFFVNSFFENILQLK